MDITALKAVYFSPTGTSRGIIAGIARGIGHRATEEVDITRPEGRKRSLALSANELLLIGVPVYFGRVQTTALEWLDTIEARDTPTVCVVVYGNRDYDDALLELKETMVKRGCRPIAGAAYIGEHSFSRPETPIAVGRPDADDLRHAEAFGEKIRQKIAVLPEGFGGADLSLPGNHPYVDMAEGRSSLATGDSIAVGGGCLQCGECARLCPVGAIDLEQGAAVDREKCILCLACLKNCPAQARTVQSELLKEIALWLSESFRGRKEPAIFW